MIRIFKTPSNVTLFPVFIGVDDAITKFISNLLYLIEKIKSIII
jgi:hypothetical protein